MTRFQGGEALPVEPGHQLRHGIAAPPSRGVHRLGEAVTGGNRQESFGTRHLRRRGLLGAADAFQTSAFARGERPEWILLGAGHLQAPWASRRASRSPSSFFALPKAIRNPPAPLV